MTREEEQGSRGGAGGAFTQERLLRTPISKYLNVGGHAAQLFLATLLKRGDPSMKDVWLHVSSCLNVWVVSGSDELPISRDDQHETLYLLRGALQAG